MDLPTFNISVIESSDSSNKSSKTSGFQKYKIFFFFTPFIVSEKNVGLTVSTMTFNKLLMSVSRPRPH